MESLRDLADVRRELGGRCPGGGSGEKNWLFLRVVTLGPGVEGDILSRLEQITNANLIGRNPEDGTCHEHSLKNLLTSCHSRHTQHYC